MQDMFKENINRILCLQVWIDYNLIILNKGKSVRSVLFI